ncbi:hypothetical protein I3760_13G109700 [Carya illinoinensis]|nr:hypothetical protein I3760_13G109700 [Carya illinoinensis]
MDIRKLCIFIIFFVLFISMDPTFVQADGNEDGKSKNVDGNSNKNNGNNDNNNSQGDDPATTDYDELAPAKTGQERAMCKAKGACKSKTLMCPSQCPARKPKNNKKMKGCFVDCSSKCEVTCKYRKPNCNGYGSLCYDPRFVGGDGVMFYFHGAKGGNFAVVSDDNLQINAHFIGTRPQGLRVTHWDDNVDALSVRWDGEAVDIAANGEEEWRTNGEEREVVVERTDDANSARVTVAHLVEIDIRVTPIRGKENKVHNYQIPADDAFAHLETQFRFAKLTDFVEGVLGKTYRPGYVSPVKIGVPMPMMGGEDKYQTPFLYSPICKACRFQRQTAIGPTKEVAQY